MSTDMNLIVGSHHILFITLDALRYDAAASALQQGQTPNLQKILPITGWECRHTPGNFTYPAHQAFFSGFLPTPTDNARSPRLFATRFIGSETTTESTFVFDQADIVSGLRAEGYHTICIGGVGFFNKKTSLSRVLPDMFDESHWQESFGVTDKNSAKNQFEFAAQLLQKHAEEKTFLFINVSAIHQPNYFYSKASGPDDLQSHQAALAEVDRHLPSLLGAYRNIGRVFGIICSDHGTAYGEDGYTGHRLNHETVLNVPYMEFVQ